MSVCNNHINKYLSHVAYNHIHRNLQFKEGRISGIRHLGGRIQKNKCVKIFYAFI
jgi:hypothetical protein